MLQPESAGVTAYILYSGIAVIPGTAAELKGMYVSTQQEQIQSINRKQVYVHVHRAPPHARRRTRSPDPRAGHNTNRHAY